MKRVLVSLLLVFLLVSVSSAQVFIGARQAGMGGTGVASAKGIGAVAFNPAGLMKGPNSELFLSVGTATQGMDQVVQSLTSATDPAKFMVDNYGTNLSANGSAYGILGASFNKIGVSILIPSLMANISKPADTLGGSISAMGIGGAVATAGYTFGVPWLPASLDVGANVKALTVASGSVTIVEPTVGNPTTAGQTVAQGSGTGIDLGARTTFEIPFLADFAVGIALRDLAQTINFSSTTRTDTYTYVDPTTEPTYAPGTDDPPVKSTATSPTTTAIGAAGTVPGIGLKVAADITSVSGGTGILSTASETVTGIGLEYPLLLNVLVLRAGVASGNNVSFTTVGAKLGLPFLTLELAIILDGKNSKNNAFVIDTGIAL